MAAKDEDREVIERRRAALDRIKIRSDAILRRVRSLGNERRTAIFENACRELHEQENPAYLAAVERLNKCPVTMEEFLESKEFYGDQYEELWPMVKQDLLDINPDIFVGETPVTEYFDGGATGTAKSFKSMATQAYQLYLLTCFDNPQSLVKLPRNTPIIMMFQSTSDTITKRVLYKPFREAFTSMPYTKRWVKYDKYNESVLHLSKQNVQVVPALASVTAMVGQAIISGILDEVNFMNVVESSKQVAGPTGKGGKYDQAKIAYTNITRRRKSRFISRGPVPGCIAVCSSVRYKDDFLDKAMKDAIDNPLPTRRVFRRAQFEVQPQSKYSGETFVILVGSDRWGTKIITGDEQLGDLPDNGTYMEIPIEFREDFRKDPDASLRDICGIATDSIHPFISQRHKIVEAVVRAKARGMKPWVERQNVELAVHGMPQIIEENLPEDKDTPRFVHIDLSKNSDRCGVALAKVDGFVNMDRGGHVESMPHLAVELAISIQPSVTKEIDIAEVRNWVLLLKTFYGFNIVMISYDGFQSAESMQAIRKAGVRSEIVSMDRTTEPYDDTKRAFYEDRLDMIDNEVARLEFANLEKSEKSGKIDHPANSSKDLSDAIAGACYTASRSRQSRLAHQVTQKDGTATGRLGRAASKRSRKPRPRRN